MGRWDVHTLLHWRSWNNPNQISTASHLIFELWYKLQFLRGTTVQITANGTDLVFLLFAALLSTILSGFDVVCHGPLVSFVVCPRSVLMIKRSPVLLVQSILFFRISLYFTVIFTRATIGMLSIVRRSPSFLTCFFYQVFFCWGSLFDHSPFILISREFFFCRESLGSAAICWCSIVLSMSNICPFIQVSSTCRLISWWLSAILNQFSEPWYKAYTVLIKKITWSYRKLSPWTGAAR